MRSLLSILLLCLVIAFTFWLFKYRDVSEEVIEVIETPPYMTTSVELDYAGDIEIQHNYIPYESTRRPGEIREVKYLVIHETDNRSRNADAKAHNTYLTTDTNDITSWHYTVDDHSIYHNLPDNEIAWHAGDKRSLDGGNMNGIGIEMCVNVGSDFDATVKNTAILCANLLYAYDLTPSDVYLHSDFMEKVCPHRLISEHKVSLFKDYISQEYQTLVSGNKEALDE